jgi:hypothetical protein
MDPMSIAFGLAQFAPGIIKWITGSDKSAAVAEKVVDIAKVVTGNDDGVDAVEMLKADPALAMQFQQAVMANEADLEKAYLADRQDARKRDVEFVKAGRHNWRADLLAFLAVAGLVICVWFVARDSDLPERAVNAIMFVAGVLASAVRDVYGFEFGSSRGSKEKDVLMQRLSEKS